MRRSLTAQVIHVKAAGGGGGLILNENSTAIEASKTQCRLQAMTGRKWGLFGPQLLQRSHCMLLCCIALPPRPTDFDTQSLMSNLSSLGVLSSLPILCPAKKLLPESQGLPWVVCPWPTARHRGRGCCAQLSRSRSSVSERTLNP